MSETILLTGGTGFLGTELAARLIRNPGLRTYTLIRSDSEAEAYHRARCAWFHDRDLYQAVGERIFPISGDFTKPGLGLDRPAQDLLRHTVTHVLHAGAEIGFQKSRQALFETNASGTAHMLAFAASLPELRRFVHISTAYVAGQKRGPVTEEEPMGRAFSSHYEESKGAGLLHNRREGGKNKNTASSFLTLLPYFFGEQEFDRANTDQLCGPYPLSWRGCIDPLLEFACRKNFMRQTGQTVFEQALIRLSNQPLSLRSPPALETGFSQRQAYAPALRR